MPAAEARESSRARRPASGGLGRRREAEVVEYAARRLAALEHGGNDEVAAAHHVTAGEDLRVRGRERPRGVRRDAHAPVAARVVVLQALLQQAIESLQASPRMAKQYHALDQTYIHPAPTQEQAAEMLDIPFSTYRRHLKEGIDHIVEILWQEEIGR